MRAHTLHYGLYTVPLPVLFALEATTTTAMAAFLLVAGSLA